MRRLREAFGLVGNGSPSWTGYLCSAEVKTDRCGHQCGQPNAIEHYQHLCRSCGFRWAALPVPTGVRR